MLKSSSTLTKFILSKIPARDNALALATLGSETQIGSHLMEQCTLENVNICWNTEVSFFFETSGGHNSNPYLKVDYFFNTSVN